MTDTACEDRMERPDWAKPTVQGFLEEWHNFLDDYEKVLDAVEDRRLTRPEAYDIVQRRFSSVETHPMMPGRSVDYAGALRDGLLTSIDDAVEESYKKPMGIDDLREKTRRYVAQCVPALPQARAGFLGACYRAWSESAMCRAVVGAACGMVASVATIPFVPDYVFDKTPSYIATATLFGAVIAAFAGKPAKRHG